MTPRDLAERTKEQEDEVALVFGREDIGLTQEQLAKCDILVNIPSNEEYPTLNLSHAATILMYEIFASHGKPQSEEGDRGRKREVVRVLRLFARCDRISRPSQEKTSVMFRRMMGRAVPTSWEFHTIMGVIGDAAKKSSDRESGK